MQERVLSLPVSQRNTPIHQSPKAKYSGISLVVERPHNKYGSAMLLLFATARSVFKSVKVSVVEIAKRTN